jgi:pyruvate dehydrogenase E1 component alpha subunit
MSKQTQRPGAATATPSGDPGFTLISNDKLLALYAAMLNCRMLRQRIHSLSAEDRNATGRGRDAAAAGVTLGLLPDDAISAPADDLSPRFLKGLALPRLLSMALSPNKGAKAIAKGDARINVLPSAETLASRLEAAESAARLGKRAKQKKIVVLFSGEKDSSGESGLWEEHLRNAAGERLPILFVCHKGPGKKGLAAMAQRNGLPGIVVDAEDVVAIYRVASEAIAHARRGNGPTLIDCRAWTLQGTKPGRRSRAGNAIRHMERYLAGKRLFSGKYKDEVNSRFARELDGAVAGTHGGTRKTGA